MRPLDCAIKDNPANTNADAPISATHRGTLKPSGLVSIKTIDMRPRAPNAAPNQKPTDFSRFCKVSYPTKKHSIHIGTECLNFSCNTSKIIAAYLSGAITMTIWRPSIFGRASTLAISSIWSRTLCSNCNPNSW